MTTTSRSDCAPVARDDVQALLEALLANSAEAIVVVDDHGDIDLITPGVAQLLGHDPDAVVGASVFDFLHPGDLEQAASLFAQRLGYAGSDPGIELHVRHSSGEWIALTATVTLLPTYATAAITLRSETSTSRERSFRRRMAVAEFTNQLGADLMSAAGAEAVMERVRRSLGEVGLLTGAEIVTIHLEGHSDSLLETLHEWREPDPTPRPPIELVHDRATVERLLSEHVVADDLTNDRNAALARFTAPIAATGLLSTPFSTGNQRGVLLLLRTRPGVSWWDTDSELARSAAELYGRALHTAWSEELLASTYRFGPMAFSVRSWDGALVDCNQRYLDLIGRTRDEAFTLPFHRLLGADARHRRPARWIELRSGDADRIEQEFELVRGDGTHVWLRSHSVPLRLPGSPEEFVITAIDDITERRNQRLELEYAASHDSLTGVANRSAMCEAIERIARPSGDYPALLLVDLDRFKLVNDGHGHVIGDAVLTTVARRLSQQVRDGDLVARLGGDEFAIVVPDVDAERALDLADRVRRSLSDPLAVEGRQLTQTVSVGIALGAGAASLADLLVRADRALYSAKAQGRNQHVLFDDSMRDKVLERLTIQRDLRRAIDVDELDVHFQPEFTVPGQRIIGAEALVRWEHPERGMIPASEFIPVAEESGLIDEIGRLALRKATAKFADMCARIGRHDLNLRVNISACEFARPELPELVEAALDASGLPADRLCLEITETTLMHAPELALATMSGLHDLGVQFAIDDFGTGYSSLVYLQRFPIDAIKIDRAFVRDIVDDAESQAIVQSVVGLCEALSLDAVAEGVETVEQLEALAGMACATAQGFLVAPALPIDELAAAIVADQG